MEQANIIGFNIKKIRERLGYNQDEVADFLSVSRPFISLIETGEREVSLPHMERLADLFNIDIIDLLEEDKDFQNLNYAFAYRSGTLTSQDLNSIADFQKVVKNYLKMKCLAHE